MNTIVIIGAGEVGATLARLIAEAELARRVVLVDENEGRARGKALDIAQAGPVDRFDVRVEGVADASSVTGADSVVIADPEALADTVLLPTRAAQLVDALGPVLAKSFLLVAGPEPSPVIEAAIARGVARERVLGSAPVAWAAALRRHVSGELRVEPREVSAFVMGLPPPHLLVPQWSVTLAGVPVDRLSPTVLRRALETLQRRRMGPVALASAAVRVLKAVSGSRSSLLPVVSGLAGEYCHRRIALAVPARLRAGRLEEIVELPLDPIDRVGFDNAAQRRYQGA